jgi:hypothetical protein
MLNSRLRIAGKTLTLSSVATVAKRRMDRATLFSVDTVDAVDLSIKQSSAGNALVLSKQIKRIVAGRVVSLPPDSCGASAQKGAEDHLVGDRQSLLQLVDPSGRTVPQKLFDAVSYPGAALELFGAETDPFPDVSPV